MRQYLLLVFVCLFHFSAHAQKLTVEGMVAVPMDLSASQYERKDLAGQSCGLVKVQLATMGAKFEGNIVGQTEYKTGEYWVYMEKGAHILKVKHPNFVPLEVDFRDYGIKGIAAKTTYTLTLLMPQTAMSVQKQGLIVNYTPADAMVLIDSKPYKGNGRVETSLTLGSHSYIIAAEGYETAEGTVKLNGGSPRTIIANLVEIHTPSVQQQSVADIPQQVSEPTTPSILQTNTNTQGTTPSTVDNTFINNAIEPFTVNGVSFNMVRVDGGTFMMGATPEQGSDAWDIEKPAHQVTLSTYSIGETEVTQELWQAVMGSNPSYYKGSNLPVENVSWDDCQTFIQKLNQLTGRRFRLPTEAEWEYAARGGSKSRGYKYSGSNQAGDVAWFWENSGDRSLSGERDMDRITKNNCRTHDVKAKRANELGLYDMSGNVWEWCQDWYGSYSSNSQTNPTGPASGSRHVYRGGSWYLYARNCRSSNRSHYTPSYRRNYLGLRLAL